MTNIFRNTLANYIAGKLTDEEKKNIPEVTKTTKINYIKKYLSELIDIDTCVITNTLSISNYTIFCGSHYDVTDFEDHGAQPCNCGFIIVLDENFEVVQAFKEFSTGTKLGPILQMNVDEDGNLYGIDMVNAKYRFIMLNNPTIKVDDEYKIVLRQSYYLPDDYQQNSDSSARDFKIIEKNPNNAEYYLFGELSGTDYTNIIAFFIHLQINVGSTNEWEEKKIDSFDYSFRISDAVITYSYNENGDALIVFCGCDNATIGRRYVQFSCIGTGDVFDIEIHEFNDNNGAYRYEAKILSKSEAYIAVTDLKDTTGTDRYYHRLKIYHKLESEYTLIYTYGSYTPLPLLSAYKKNNLVCFFYQSGIGYDNSDGLTIQYVEPVFFVCFDDTVLNVTFSLIHGTYSSFLTMNISIVNNIICVYIQFDNTCLKIYFFKSLENSYSEIDCLLPDYSNFRRGSTILYSKDLENFNQKKKICISTVNIPASDLNDTNINYELLYSKTNMIMMQNTKAITKNIYENVYVNYVHGYSFKNENETKSEMTDNSELLMSATLNQGYSNFFIKNLIAVYEDDTEENFELSSTIENYYTIHFTCTFSPEKNVKKIKMTNTDMSVIFIEKNVELEAGKQYEFVQDVEVA